MYAKPTYTIAYLFTLSLFLTQLWSFNIHAQPNQHSRFEDWFENKALRIDYVLGGDSNSQHFYLDEVKVEQYWSKPHSKTIDSINLGTYRVEVFDKKTGTLIYSHGFCTLFEEWQSVEEAKNIHRSFEQVTRVPLPKNEAIVTFKQRNKQGLFQELYRLPINPNSNLTKRTPTPNINVTEIINNGHFNKKLDIAFIAEGYTTEQMEKFRSDVERLSSFLISQKPFDKHKNNINIWAIESVSKDEGPSNPKGGVWNNTSASSSFYTFGIERYLTTLKFNRVMDIAANAPADIVYILVNSEEYGGGGIYNHYCITTSGHNHSENVFIHELGHGLTGLGDEYYTSDVAYQDYYPLNIEPWEPNLTTMINFENKWADMIEKTTPIPTPAIKKHQNKVGAFEGGGYVEKGVYRPFMNCRMKSNSANDFCPVCQAAIERVIESYTD
ncbi:MAG: M64 family metallopeptidase [Bacteroidales bacterium]